MGQRYPEPTPLLLRACSIVPMPAASIDMLTMNAACRGGSADGPDDHHRHDDEVDGYLENVLKPEEKVRREGRVILHAVDKLWWSPGHVGPLFTKGMITVCRKTLRR